MATKLTLRLDENLIERAKRYAATQRTSLSRLVGNFFHSLEPKGRAEADISGTVAELTGILPSKIKIASLEQEYRKKLARKHQ